MSDHAQIFRGLLWTIPSTLTTQIYCRCYPDKICLPQRLPKRERSGKSFHNRMSSFSMLNTPILNPGINTTLFSLASDLLSLGKDKWTYKVLKRCIVAPSIAFRWSRNNPFTVAKNKSRYEYHKPPGWKALCLNHQSGSQASASQVGYMWIRLSTHLFGNTQLGTFLPVVLLALLLQEHPLQELADS